MKQNRHTLMAKGIMVLLSLMVLVFILAFSWFSTKQTADATGLSGGIEADGDFEYAIGFYNNSTGGSYKITDYTSDSTALNLKALRVYDGTSSNNDGNDSGRYYHDYNLLHDYTPIDVTGDGRTLIRPAMSYGNRQIDQSSNDYSLADPNVQYITFDLYFRSKSTGVPIKLGNGSWAKGNSEINNLGYTGSSTSATFNKSTYGNFSKDAIIGAVRIAFVPYTKGLPASFASLSAYEDDTPEYLADSASLLWLPKPELQLNEPSGGGVTGWTLSTNANNNQHTYYSIFETGHPKQIKTYPSTITTSMITSQNREFARIDNSVHIGEYYYTKASVRIWVEGTDAEARRATSGGKFEVNFKLTTID